MKERLFRFKKFNVSHARSSMPIGVDGVLIGAWASCNGVDVLDVGTGCGVIAMMIAQRNPMANVTAIDVDTPSVEEATLNFSNSPWKDRLEAQLISFSEITGGERMFDSIISNPPFFDAGVGCLDTSRKAARHVGTLSPMALIEDSGRILRKDGTLSLIAPSEMMAALQEKGTACGMTFTRGCLVRDNANSPVKRIMMEFRKEEEKICQSRKEEKIAGNDIIKPEIKTLTMFERGQTPTSEYRNLCCDFYIKF